MKRPIEIELEFARGGVLRAAILWDSAPETCRAVIDALPLEATVSHSRWSGREVNFPIALGPGGPPRENDTTMVNTGRHLLAGVGEGRRRAKPLLSTTAPR
jgi:hypothetical protein